MEEVIVKRAETRDEINRAFRIRYEVFVREQNVPARLERDEYDEPSVHVLAYISGETVGCGRVYINAENAKIGRVAVLEKHRSAGVGAAICKKLIEISKHSGARKIVLHAQVGTTGFYKKLGFTEDGGVFTEAGIEHVKMVRESKWFG